MNLQSPKNKKILYLYTGDHPVHRKFAESVKADIRKMSWKIPQGYDLYFSEGEYTRLVLLKLIRRIPRKSKLIILLSDPRLFHLNTKYKFNAKKRSVMKTSKIRNFILKKLLGKTSGVLCGGKFEESLLTKFNKKLPRRIVCPFISTERIADFKKIEPPLKQKKILFIGNGPDFYYKGIDKLIETFKELRKKDSEITLGIVGEWDIKDEWKVPGVEFYGMQKNIQRYLEESSLYLHLGRGEAFGVTIIEAMVAGVPAIVSDITGAKEVVEKVSPKFVVSLKEEGIIKRVKEYFGLSIPERKRLGESFRKEGLKINEKEMLTTFKKEFDSLIKEIYNNDK
jgi:glycosyltransferase involved in cell wall biosynthesis